MIEPSKFTQSLRAVQDVFVLARKLAHERADHATIARLLDHAEYLPALILDDEDTTGEFRDNLADIAKQFSWGILLERFDEQLPEGRRLVGQDGQRALP